MSIACDAYHQRAEVLRDVVAELESNGGEDLPWSDRYAEVFADRAELLVALHAMWGRRLHARVDLALELGEDLPAESVVTAWHEVASELSAVRRVLEAHADDPALARSERHGNRMLAVAAGLATVDTPVGEAARAGSRLVARVRGVRVPLQRDEAMIDRFSPSRRKWMSAMYAEAASRAS